MQLNNIGFVIVVSNMRGKNAEGGREERTRRYHQSEREWKRDSQTIMVIWQPKGRKVLSCGLTEHELTVRCCC